MPLPQRAFLLGPTASGKTEVGVELALRLDAEILSMDSMLVYRGMDVGTAKPDAAARARVPHHLMDLVAPSEEFSAARWVEAARRVEAEVAARGRRVLYVGGTALYLKALLHGLAPRAAPAEVRASLAEELEAPGGAERLRAELERVDPEAARSIHPNDRRRLLRALEHHRAFGRPWSEDRAAWPEGGRLGEPAVALWWPRDLLHERIHRRFRSMVEAGLLDEIRRILATSGFGPTAARAIGYRQLLPHVQEGEDLEICLLRAERATRVLVRRQTTWLRSFPDLQGLACGAEDRPSELAERACRLLGAAN